jgi:adenylate cyclase
MYYLTFSALGVLFLGPERRRLAVAFAALGATLSIVLHLTVPPSTGLVPPGQLFYVNFVSNIAVNTAILVAVVYYAMRQIGRAEAAAEREHQRSESLLLNVLPASVAARLKRDPEGVIADAFPEASVLFADLAGFTARGAATTPVELVRFLNDVFSRLDALVERHGLEKIKSTGDSYMVVSGVPEPRPDHAEALADLALEMRDAVAGLLGAEAVPMRIGIASGPVVAGVVGTARFFYDVWGDAVNLATRMEQTGEIGRIQIGPETQARLRDLFVCAPRGTVAVRGRGAMHTWYLVGRKRAAG